MRILAISNVYPPYSDGGYELGCQQVVDRMRARGHTANVLTSYHGLEGPQCSGQEHRILHLFAPKWADFRSTGACLMALARWQRDQAAAVRAVVQQEHPDVAAIWSLRGLASNAILHQLDQLCVPAVVCVSDYWFLAPDRDDPWLAFWQTRGRLGLPKECMRKLVGCVVPTAPAPLNWQSIYFVSEALRRSYHEAGNPVSASPIIRWGVDTSRFAPGTPRNGAEVVRVLFAGRLIPDKGPQTVIEALRHLSDHAGPAIHLTIAGAGERNFELSLRAAADAVNGRGRCHIEFVGKVGYGQMPDLYRDHDIYVFPSIWPEPFALGLLEAMASGMTVVATAAGGSAEIMRHGENGLVFTAGDPVDLSRHLAAMVECESRRSIAARSLAVVAASHGIDRTIDAVERLVEDSVQPRE